MNLVSHGSSFLSPVIDHPLCLKDSAANYSLLPPIDSCMNDIADDRVPMRSHQCNLPAVGVSRQVFSPPSLSTEEAPPAGGGGAQRRSKGNIGAETVTSKFKAQVRRGAG